MIIRMLSLLLCGVSVLLFMACPFGSESFQLTIQIEKEGTVVSTISKTVLSGESLPISAETFGANVFVEWKAVSGSASISEPSKKNTTVTIASESVIKAVYYKAYLDPFNDHYYMYYDALIDWNTARIACEQKGGYLVTITTEEEQHYLNSLLYYWNLDSSNFYWGGMFQPLTSDAIDFNFNWQWVTGENNSYNVFIDGQPNNSSGDDDYLRLQPTSSWVWNDVPLNHSGGIGYLCEWGWDENFIQKKVFNNHSYAYVDISMTWDRAKDYCEKLGGHLVTINSEAEQVFINSINGTGIKPYYWLGGENIGSANAKEGWKWIYPTEPPYKYISDSSVFVNWVDDLYPDSTLATNRLFLRSSDGKWIDGVNNPTAINDYGILIEWE